ncbi:MAG: LLM class F420-dependent oxidoreductase [Acidimicrobiia bacterium]
MKFLTEYPFGPGPGDAFVDAANIAEFLRVAEAAGLDAVTFSEHPAPSRKWMEMGGHGTFEPFVALAYCAGLTTSMRLMSHMAVAGFRNPFQLAKAITTLDVVSNGRAILGLGSGYLRSEFAALGVDFQERGALFDECLEALDGIFTDDDFRFDGRHFTAVGNWHDPKPVQRPHPPYWLAGNTGRALDRVARWADGWAPNTMGEVNVRTTRTRRITSIEHLGELIEQLGDRLEANGRSLDGFDVSAISPGKFISSDDSIEYHLDAIGELAAIGVTWTMFPYPRNDFGAALDYIRMFGEEVVAKVR